MKNSLIILLFFILGILIAYFRFCPDLMLVYDPSLYVLWLLMGLVGISLGANRKLAHILHSLHPTILLLPLFTMCGTFLGAVGASFFTPVSVPDSLAIGSGFAYYSLSSIFITQYKGPDLGAIALIANILRELFTLLFTPLIMRLFGPMAVISCGGASTMDTTLPIITRYTGSQWVFPSIIHAMILDFSVPFWVTLFCSI